MAKTVVCLFLPACQNLRYEKQTTKFITEVPEAPRQTNCINSLSDVPHEDVERALNSALDRFDDLCIDGRGVDGRDVGGRGADAWGAGGWCVDGLCVDGRGVDDRGAAGWRDVGRGVGVRASDDQCTDGEVTPSPPLAPGAGAAEPIIGDDNPVLR